MKEKECLQARACLGAVKTSNWNAPTKSSILDVSRFHLTAKFCKRKSERLWQSFEPMNPICQMAKFDTVQNNNNSQLCRAETTERVHCAGAQNQRSTARLFNSCPDRWRNVAETDRRAKAVVRKSETSFQCQPSSIGGVTKLALFKREFALQMLIQV